MGRRRLLTQKQKNRRASRKSTATIVIMVPVVSGAVAFALAFLGFPVLGIDLSGPAKATTTKKVEGPYDAAYAKTPAAGVINSVMSTLDGSQWKRDGRPVDAAGLPNPLSCVQPAPVLSDSRLYKTSRGNVQVTMTAYSAGVGSAAFYRQHSKVGECKAPTVSVVSDVQSGVGVEARIYSVSYSGNNIRYVAFRRGDIIGYVAQNASQSADIAGTAAIVDKILNEAMPTSVCVQQDSTFDDSRRNAFYAKGKFTGNLQTKRIKTDAVEEPELTTEQIMEDITAVKIPAKAKNVNTVLRPERPVYPVYPDLPNERALPEMPVAPEPQKLETGVKIRVDDPAGPGCGWAFTNTIVPVFDEAAAEASNTAVVNKAEARLEKDGPRWQDDVVTYWTQYAQYLTDVSDYRRYAEKVDEVRAAWAAIGKQWDAYYTALANWQIGEDARLQFIADQEAAQTKYDDAVEVCDELAASPEVPDPEAVQPVCPPVPDPILSQKPPKAVEKPSEPKDPRP